MKAAGAKRILIVSPAIVRENWAREVTQTLGVQPGVIRFGPTRKLSAKLAQERLDAYAADVLIVSYDLLGKIRSGPWDGIIIDEIHNLRTCTSRQSKQALSVVRVNPDAHILGLSGTLVPRDARTVWNPVDTIWPGFLGNRTVYGDISWSYLARYCIKETNAYGTIYYGLREDNADKLRDKLSTVAHRVTTEDFAQYLPPLHVQPIHIWSDRPDILKIARDWYESVRWDVDHVGIYCHHRKTAEDLMSHLKAGMCITGRMPAYVRDSVIQDSRASDSSLIVGTTHALSQGISLSFQKAVLVVEWVTAPDQIVQFIGRFARQDSVSMAPTTVSFLVGPNDTGRAEKLCNRITDINKLLTPGKSETIAQQAFEAKEMGEDEFEASVARLIEGSQKRAQLWSTDEEDIDADEEA